MLSERELAALLLRLEGILERVESVLPPPPPPPDWRATAFRWRKRAGRGHLQTVLHPHAIGLDDLVAIDEQKRAVDANTRQFVAGLPANNVLLTGSRDGLDLRLLARLRVDQRRLPLVTRVRRA